jgi:hypothetical protein
VITNKTAMALKIKTRILRINTTLLSLVLFIRKSIWNGEGVFFSFKIDFLSPNIIFNFLSLLSIVLFFKYEWYFVVWFSFMDKLFLLRTEIIEIIPPMKESFPYDYKER